MPINLKLPSMNKYGWVPKFHLLIVHWQVKLASLTAVLEKVWIGFSTSVLLHLVLMNFCYKATTWWNSTLLAFSVVQKLSCISWLSTS
jgi:hypothetical protein